MATDVMAEHAETVRAKALPSLELPTTYAELDSVLNILKGHSGYANHRNALAADNENPAFKTLREHELALSFWHSKHSPDEALGSEDANHIRQIFQLMGVPGHTVKSTSWFTKFNVRSLFG